MVNKKGRRQEQELNTTAGVRFYGPIFKKFSMNNPKSKRPIVYWNAKKFLEWLYKYKANQNVQYNHQQTEKNIAVAVIKGAKKYGNE